MRPSPPPGLAKPRSEADGRWGSAVTVAAVGLIAPAPVPAAAQLAQAEAQALPRPPPPGFTRDYHVARALPFGGGQPAAATATVAESKRNPSATPARQASTPPTLDPMAVLESKPIHGGSSGGGGSGGATQSTERQGEGSRFGQYSTKVSFEERSRRNRVLRAEAPPFYPAAHSRKGTARGAATPAAFPEQSRLPSGGYYMEEGPDDTLPPPSPYEVQEAARMFRVYDEMVERLRTTGLDETLPNGFTPRIYDFTDGGC